MPEAAQNAVDKFVKAKGLSTISRDQWGIRLNDAVRQFIKNVSPSDLYTDEQRESEIFQIEDLIKSELAK